MSSSRDEYLSFSVSSSIFGETSSTSFSASCSAVSPPVSSLISSTISSPTSSTSISPEDFSSTSSLTPIIPSSSSCPFEASISSTKLSSPTLFFSTSSSISLLFLVASGSLMSSSLFPDSWLNSSEPTSFSASLFSSDWDSSFLSLILPVLDSSSERVKSREVSDRLLVSLPGIESREPAEPCLILRFWKWEKEILRRDAVVVNSCKYHSLTPSLPLAIPK